VIEYDNAIVDAVDDGFEALTLAADLTLNSRAHRRITKTRTIMAMAATSSSATTVVGATSDHMS
jgi:hypothetical protein